MYLKYTYQKMKKKMCLSGENDVMKWHIGKLNQE